MTRAFVGRDRELAELQAGLQDAMGGRRRLFLVTGGPGIGKTALADQLATHAAGRGARVLWGRCWEGGGAPPYWPWAQLIGTLAEGFDGETLASYLGPGAPHVARLVPELSERLGDAAAAPGPPPGSDAARFYLFEAIARLFSNASSDAPLLLVLDDLQAADSSALLLLRFLARDIRACRLLVVGTCRDMDATGPVEAADAFGELVREGDLLRLGGLDREAVADLITELSGIVADGEKVAAICEATEGNPLFVREVVRLVASAGELARPGRVRVPIPEGVRAVIRQRLVPLSADAVQVLSAAAVVGRDFELSLLGAASDLPLDRLLSGLSDAVALGVVTEEPGTAGQFRFSHPLMRELIYEDLPIPARMQLHQLVGEAIEQRYRPDCGPHLAQLAHHFAQAAAAGQGAKGLHYARRAGDRAMDTCAYREAAAEYRRALQALESTGPDEASRCELLLRLGGAQARSGDYQEAKASYLQAAEIARTLGSTRQLARAALGFGEPQVEGSLVNREVVALLQEALGGLSEKDDPLRARMLARLSLELTFSGEAERRESFSREAVDMARRLGDIASLGSALRARWLARWEPEGLDERAGLAEELLRLARETGDRELELRGRARRIPCSLERGRIREVEADIAAHARLADELRMPVHQGHAATMLAMLALLRGAFEEGERLADQALSLQAGRATPQFAHRYQLALIRWEQGRLGEMRDSWQQLVRQFPQVGLARAWLCLAEAEAGHSGDARMNLRSMIDGLSGLPRDGLWLPALATASLVSAQLDEAEAAESLYPALSPYRGRIIAFAVPEPAICLGSASFYLGLLASVMSRWEEADSHFQAALSAHDRLGATALLARSQYEHARMLIRRGRAPDRSRAAGLLDRAYATADAIGMTRAGAEIQRLRELTAGQAIAAARAGEATAMHNGAARNMLRREGDYWTVAYEGSLVRLRDSKGLRYLARLLASPGRELHALDIEMTEHRAGHPAPPRPADGVATADLSVRPDPGDAGELLDAKAKAAYKARLDELQAEIDEAESFNDPGRAARARDEKAFLVAELARAVGLGGRDRRAASHTERARLNVTRAIRAAVANLDRVNPALGRHLAATIRTGRYCSYTPDPRAPTAWEL